MIQVEKSGSLVPIINCLIRIRSGFLECIRPIKPFSESGAVIYPPLGRVWREGAKRDGPEENSTLPGISGQSAPAGNKKGGDIFRPYIPP